MNQTKTKGDRFITSSNNSHVHSSDQNFDLDECKENKYRQLLLMCNQKINSVRTLSYQNDYQPDSCLIKNSMIEELNQISSRMPQKASLKIRQVCSSPEKILDAPEIVDDFYLNILDWGMNNLLAIGLSSNLYIWNAKNGQIEQLLGHEQQPIISAVHWINNDILSVGFENGMINLIDINTQEIVDKLSYHIQRVNSISSCKDLISSGGRDYTIINHDIREKNRNIVSVFDKHTQEVCGLKWQQQTQILASGANDNLVMLWDKRKMKQRSVFLGHGAAVKALAWCPWQNNGLATGGGSNDRTIRFWNTDTSQCDKVIDAGSQVCALQFLSKQKEMISSHGFSKFEIALWKAENLQKNPIKMQELQGHQSRVLHLGVSPDETMLCSAAGDETLRFWRVGSDSHHYEDSPKKGLMASKKRLNLR